MGRTLYVSEYVRHNGIGVFDSGFNEAIGDVLNADAPYFGVYCKNRV